MRKFATEKEVLAAFRMLTKEEAVRRRVVAAFLIGLIFAVICGVFPVVSLLVYVSFAVFFASTMNKMFLADKNNTDEEFFSRSFSLSGPGENQLPPDAVNQGGLREDAARELVADRSNNVSRYAILTLFSFAFAFIFYYILDLWILRSFAVSLLSFVLIYEVFFDTVLGMARSPEVPEYPTRKWHVFLKWMDRMFAESRGFYFIGKVNGKRIGLPRLLRFLHTLIIGPTGEMKTSSLIQPQLLLDASSGGSAVDIDAKSPQHFEFVAGRWIAEGKRVYLFDPWHPNTVAINPLPGADDEALLIMVEVMMKEREEMLKPDPFFASRTKYLLFAILKLVQAWKDEYCNLASVYHSVQSVNFLKAFIESASPEIKGLFDDYDKYFGPETKVNALTSIRDKLDIFMDEDVRKAFSRSDFTLDMLFRENNPCLLIIGTPVDKEAQGVKIASLLANLIGNLAFKERRLQRILKHKGEKSFKSPDLYMYLDELRKLKIIRLPDLVSIAREARIHIIGSVTDLGFLKYYGQDFDSLLGNFRTKVALGGLDINSAAYISKSLGRCDKPKYNFFFGRNMVTSTEIDIKSPSEIQGLPIERVLVFPPVTNIRPFIAEKVNIFTSKWLQNLHLPLPKNIKEKYQEWGLSIEPLIDPVLPKIKGDFFDFARIIDPNKRVSVDPRVIDRFFKEQGGGKFVRNEQQDDSEMFSGNISKEAAEDMFINNLPLNS